MINLVCIRYEPGIHLSLDNMLKSAVMLKIVKLANVFAKDYRGVNCKF